METVSKTTQFKKRKDTKLQTIYSRCLLTRKIVVPINLIGKNLDEVIEEYIHNNFEGKCITEGYVKPRSTKIVRYSSGLVERGSNVVFEVVFECDICFPVEGMLISCVVKNVVKAGVRAESSSDVPSPFVVFIAKDHRLSSHQLNELQVGDIITAKVIGQRFELNDKSISIIAKLVIDKESYQKPKQTVKPRLVIDEN